MAASAYCSSSIGAGSFSSTARPFGSQVRRGPYASQPACSATARPALWLTVGTLWGDRIEHIGEDALRPAIPVWSLGLRAAALRWGDDRGAVSALELGVGSNFSGALWLELTLLQAGARW